MENKSGIQPLNKKVLVLPDEVGERLERDSLIVMPKIAQMREVQAQIRGTVVAVNDLCFTDRDGVRWDRYPKPDDHVVFLKYSGDTVKGVDGVDYRLIADADIVAILEE